MALQHLCCHHHYELRALASDAGVIGESRYFEIGGSVLVNLLKISVGSNLTFSFFSQSMCMNRLYTDE